MRGAGPAPGPPQPMPPRNAPPRRSGPSNATESANQPLTTDMLQLANDSQKKQMIGERIFPKIQHREPKLAGKITGMLLEMDNMELLHLLDDETALMAKINEALVVLNQHAPPKEDKNAAE